MKYINEFIESKDKQEFINRCRINHIGIKDNSFERAHLDLRKILQITVTITENIIIEDNKQEVMTEFSFVVKPSPLKMLMLEDMINMKIDITDAYLLKYGFLPGEIIWLKENKFIGVKKNESKILGTEIA